ncbi:MAG: PEP/pyruvate-binding domain-containing protein [Pirellulaceae bacterium]
MQDIEFTIERGTLFMLQTRNGKRTGAAALKIAADMVKEGMIDEKAALLRISANDLTPGPPTELRPRRQKTPGTLPLTKGLPRFPEAAVGALAFSTRGSGQ